MPEPCLLEQNSGLAPVLAEEAPPKCLAMATNRDAAERPCRGGNKSHREPASVCDDQWRGGDGVGDRRRKRRADGT